MGTPGWSASLSMKDLICQSVREWENLRKLVAEGGYKIVIRMLHKAGVDINKINEKEGPMMAIVCCGRDNGVKVLVELGAKRIDREKSVNADELRNGTYLSGVKIIINNVMMADNRH